MSDTVNKINRSLVSTDALVNVRLVNQNEEDIIIRQTFKTTHQCCVAQQQICIKSFVKYIYLMTADYQLIEDVFALNCFAREHKYPDGKLPRLKKQVVYSHGEPETKK